MKSKIITIINEKGGTGKTTTSFNLAYILKASGYKILVVDMDPQHNLTSTIQGADTETKNTIYKCLQNEITPAEAIQHLYFDLIPASKMLALADGTFTQTGKEYKLKEVLESIRNFYDFIIIDTAPSLNILSINTLTACDYVIIPAKADIYSLQGMDQLDDTIKTIKKYTNNKIKIAGVLLTHYTERSPHDREIKEYFKKFAKAIKTKVFNATIRNAPAIFKKSIATQKSIFEIDKNNPATKDFLEFTKEFLKDTTQN